VRSRPTGSLVADRCGKSTAYALLSLQERGSLFVSPGLDVYEGMVIGESPRSKDMDVNPTREKKQTNTRSSTAEVTEKLSPPTTLSLEQALEFIRHDECLEVTPVAVRLRKTELTARVRARQRSHARE
jgi:GTP-binding protein